MNVMSAEWQAPGASAVTIGVFDGVHRGHQALIGTLGGAARQTGLRAGAFTFDPHPVEVLSPGRAPLLLTPVCRRVALLMEEGIDWVGTLDLADIRMMSPHQFIEEVLVARGRVRMVAVGRDFRFGHDRAGDIALLEREGGRFGFEVVAVDLVDDGAEVISSTRIRRLVADGQVAEAARLLGREHRVSGPVIRGEARGRALNYPTANLACPAGIAIPADGIYAVRANGRDGVASLGVRPTFGPGGARLLEVHIFDFEGNLYGLDLDVDFVARLRGEEKFETVDELVAQMDRDTKAARAELGQR